MNEFKEPIVFYTIQSRRSHESPWNKPNGRLRRVYGNTWHTSWLSACDPHIGRGNDYRPRNKASHADYWDIFTRTGRNGWARLKHAQQALRRCVKASEAGELDTRDGYAHACQKVRYEFRIVRCYYHYSWEELT